MHQNIKQIHEVTSGIGHNSGASPETVKEVNDYLALGWVLLDIHERGYDYSRIGEDSRIVTIYILGSYETKPKRP